MHKLISSCIFLLVAITTMAVVATPEIITYKQSDGTEIYVRLMGDENFSWFQSVDGKILTKTPNGDLKIANKYEIRDFNLKKIQKQKIAETTAQTQVYTNCPTKGTVRIPVLLIAFKNLDFVTENPQKAFTDFFNGENYSLEGATSSVKTYYKESSNGALTLIFDIYGPYTTNQNYEYYGANKDGNHNQHVNEMIVNAAIQARKQGVDFSQYDANNDGRVDNISAIFAGHNEAEGGNENTIWPHRSSIVSSERFNGKALDTYLVISELRGSNGNSKARIGTYCHEFGHVLGLPDLYNTTTNGNGAEQIYTVGSWDIMSSGNYNNQGHTPPLFSAFERYMLGWLTPKQITETGHYKLPPLATTNQAYLIAATTHNVNKPAADGDEFFLLENRQRIGLESNISCLPGTGLLISHITFSAKKWNNATFNNLDKDSIIGYDIVEAYNLHPTAASASDSYPGSMNITSMMPILNSGDSLTNYELTSIYSWSDNNVTFNLGSGNKNGIMFDPSKPDIFTSAYDKQFIDYNPQEITIHAEGIQTDSVRIQLSNDNFSIYYQDNWLPMGEGLTIGVNANHSVNEKLLLRFEPKRQSCSTLSTLLQVYDLDTTYTGFCTLLGQAPRPIYITAPQNVTITEKTNSSFRINWEEQEDAEVYYINVYDDEHSEPISTKEVVAPNDHTYITSLPENKALRIEIICYENKGCEEHFSEPTIVKAQTRSEKDYRIKLNIIQDGNGCTINIAEYQDESLKVYIYTTDGRLVKEDIIPLGQQSVTFNSTLFRKNDLYIVKCTPISKFKRKAYWGKFIYKGL